MATFAAIRSQVYSLLRETPLTDSNFTDAQINAFINQAIKMAVPIIEQPRKDATPVAAVQGTTDYAVPSDFVRLNTADFGDVTLANDVKPLTFVTPETLRSLFPFWRSTHVSNQGRPSYIAFAKDEDTLFLYPPPNAAEAVSGKYLIYNYLFYPADLSADSDTPDLPLPYHDILKFYVAHLCYLNLGNGDLATKMYGEFIAHDKQIRLASTIESKEALGWEWAYDDGVNDDIQLNTGENRI